MSGRERTDDRRDHRPDDRHPADPDDAPQAVGLPALVARLCRRSLRPRRGGGTAAGRLRPRRDRAHRPAAATRQRHPRRRPGPARHRPARPRHLRPGRLRSPHVGDDRRADRGAVRPGRCHGRCRRRLLRAGGRRGAEPLDRRAAGVPRHRAGDRRRRPVQPQYHRRGDRPRAHRLDPVRPADPGDGPDGTQPRMGGRRPRDGRAPAHDRHPARAARSSSARSWHWPPPTSAWWCSPRRG